MELFDQLFSAVVSTDVRTSVVLVLLVIVG